MALIDIKRQAGTITGNPSEVDNYFIFLNSDNSDALTLRNSSGVDTVYRTGEALTNRIIVNQANKDTTLGGTIDSTKQYFLDGNVDMGATSIVVPSTGLFIASYTNEIILSSTEDNYTMFTGGGNVFFDSIGIEVSGTSSQVYNLVDPTGFNAIELTTVNYNNCTSLGELRGFRQGLEFNTGRFGGTPELTLSGTWLGGFRITTSITRSLDDAWTGTMFKAGASFLMNSRFLTDMNVDLGSLHSFLDFSTTNFNSPSLLELDSCIISRDGVFDSEDANITPNISASDLQSRFTNNKGITNTFQGITAKITTTSQTTITSSGTYFDLLGTYTTSDAQHFSSSTNGEWVNEGDNPIEYEVFCSFVIQGGANDELELGVFKSDGVTETEINSQVRDVNNSQGGNDVGYFSFKSFAQINQSEFILLKIKNNDDTTNVTARLGSTINISKR